MHDDVDQLTLVDQSLEELDFLRSACAAAQRGQADKLQALLTRPRGPGGATGWGLHGEDGGAGSSGLTPLHYAAREGHLGCVRVLLAAGADVGRRTTAGGATALHRASHQGHVAVIQALYARQDKQ